MKNTYILNTLLLGYLSLMGITTGCAQSLSNTAHIYQLQNYTLGNMAVGVNIPGNWNAGPIIIGKVSEAGQLTFEWPATVPEALKEAADQLNYVIRTGNCDPGEEGNLESDSAKYVLFDRIWLMNPETNDVQGQLMANNSDSLMAWMHKPDVTKAATGTYAYLLYAYNDNTLHSTCQHESWITPEEQDEITLEHKFENDLKVSIGFQFVIYENKEVHAFEGVQPKWQQVNAATRLPEGVQWKVKE